MYSTFTLPNGDVMNVLRLRTWSGTYFWRVAIIPAWDREAGSPPSFPTRDFKTKREAEAYADEVASSIV